MLLSCCGAQPTPTAQIRSNFVRLQHAFRDHDAQTVCELLFPFGEHQPPADLTTDLKKLDQSAAARTRYRAYVASCAPEFAKRAANFADYERIFAGLAITTVTVRGNRATVRVSSNARRVVNLSFVRAAGEWRLLIGVQ